LAGAAYPDGYAQAKAVRQPGECWLDAALALVHQSAGGVWRGIAACPRPCDTQSTELVNRKANAAYFTWTGFANSEVVPSSPPVRRVAVAVRYFPCLNFDISRLNPAFPSLSVVNPAPPR
jgi:hypothetical protein